MSAKVHSPTHPSESNDSVDELDSSVMEKIADYLQTCGIKVTISSEQTKILSDDVISMSNFDPVTLNYLAEYVQRIPTQDDIQSSADDDIEGTDVKDTSEHVSDVPCQVLSKADNEQKDSYNHQSKDFRLQDEELLKLDPFQRMILERIDEQNRKLDALQSQIENISKLMSIDLETKVTKERNRPNQLEADLNERFVAEEAALDERIVVLLDTFFDRIMYIPRQMHQYFVRSRVYRLLSLIQREARGFQVPGNPNARFFDLHLLMKISFICFFLNARMQLSVPARDAPGTFFGEMLATWKMYRATMVFLSGVIVYFIQSGLVFFIVHIVFKDNVLRRVWNDEDLPQNNDTHPVPPRHRGRRDRERNREHIQEEHNQQDEVREEPPGQDNAQAAPQPPARPRNIREIINDTFLGGVIGRPNPNRIINDRDARHLRQEEILLYRLVKSLLEGFLDALYIFGSFFLSILPMWHPRPGPEFPCQSKDLIDAILNDDLEKVSEIVRKQKELIRKRDKNGWEPIHEAARAGKRDSIELLLSHSADINARTGVDEKGGSVLFWAMRYNDPDGDFVSYLREKGAIFRLPGQDVSDESEQDETNENGIEQVNTSDEN
jgi:hypothetical protein